jgi:hypothetical protein
MRPAAVVAILLLYVLRLVLGDMRVRRGRVIRVSSYRIDIDRDRDIRIVIIKF